MTTEIRRYRVQGLIGRGGFGSIYLATLEAAHGFSKAVAIKMLTDDDPPEEVLQRLRDEARILGLVRDRAVVAVDPPVQLGGRWAVVMDFVDGRSLAALLDDNGAIPEGPALAIVAEVARALDVLWHAPGPDGEPLHLLHRDLKPDNLQLTGTGEVKLLDFGIAKATFADREVVTTSALSGTAGYVAPERMAGDEGPTTDVFSLGIVLMQLVTGQRPRLEQMLSGSFDGVSAETVAFARTMASLDPTERPLPAQVESRALQLAKSRPRTLGSWARSVVPDNVRPEADPLKGTVLVEERQIERTGMTLRGNSTLVGVGGVSFGIVALSVAFVLLAVGASTALWWQLQLREADRERLDARTLEQARMLAEVEPARALELVADLSEGHPFQGDVHAVVSTAIGAHPARRLPLLPGFTPDEFAVGEAGMLAASGNRIQLYRPDLTPERLILEDDNVHGVAVTRQERLFCTGSRLVSVDRGWSVPLPSTCQGLSTVDGHVVVVVDDALLLLEGRALEKFGPFQPNTSVASWGRFLWTASSSGANRYEIGENGQVARSNVTYQMGLMYGVDAHAGGLAVTGEEPSLMLVEQGESGELEAVAPDVGGQWLATAAVLDEDFVLMGGDSPRVQVLDLRDGSMQSVPVRGKPYAIRPWESGAMVTTDAGHLAFLERHPLGFSSRTLGSPAEPLLDMERSRSGDLVVAGRTTLSLQRPQTADGSVVISSSSRARLVQGADAVHVILEEGVYRLRGTRVERVGEGALSGTDCGGALFVARQGNVSTLAGESLPVPSRFRALSCSGGVGVALLDDGTVLAWDPQDLVRHAYYALEGSDGGITVGTEAGPVVTGHGAWQFEDALKQPTVLFDASVSAAWLTWYDGELVVGTRGGVVQTAGGRRLGTMSGMVTSMTSFEGQLFVTGYYGALLRWRSLEQPPESVAGHTQYVGTVTPHPKGRWLATAGWDDRAWIWDTASDPMVGRPLPDHGAAILSLAWSPEGDLLYTADRLGRVRAWRHDVPTEPEALRATVNHTLARLGIADR